MNDDAALRAILQTAFTKLRIDVEIDVSLSADKSSKVREVALKTLDDLRARIVADPGWLDSVSATLRNPKPPSD